MKFSCLSSILLLLVSSNHMIGECQAWFSSSSSLASSLHHYPPMLANKANNQNGRLASTSLHYSNDETTDENNNNDDNDKKTSQSPQSTVERIVVSGVSVSPKGFHVLFSTPRKGILPLPVTKDPQDSYKATSPESLTILQLLSQVDMAGAILPPELLAQMAICQSELEYYENVDNENGGNSTTTKSAGQVLAEYMQTQLPNKDDCKSYKDAHPWFQSRMTLPQITLDQLTIRYSPQTHKCTSCQLTCALPKNILWTASTTDREVKSTSLVVNVTPELVEPFAYQYNPETSHIFTSLALALRYKAPIVLEVEETDDEQQQQEDDDCSYYYPQDLLEEDFAQRTSLQNLQRQTSRLSQNIEKGFKANQLMGALQIAKRLGDQAAIQKIQDKLAEYDNMDDLPVVGQTKVANEEEQLEQEEEEITTSTRRMMQEVDDDNDSNAFQ